MKTRREFISCGAQTAAWLALASGMTKPHAAETARLRLGSCMIDLPQAKAAGLDGVEVNVGPAADRLQIADEAVRRRYKEQMRETGLAIPSLMMGLLNGAPLAADPRGPDWLAQSIDAARDLGAQTVLVAFFGKGDLLDAAGKVKQQDVDVVVERLRAFAPRAKEAGVTLAIENTLPAAENIRILDSIGHESVKVYYDVFNTGVSKGYDVPAEIRLLKRRIAQVHFKNGPRYLEDRANFFEPIVAALKDIGYAGWIVLETSSPSKDPVADARRNAEFVRRLLGRDAAA
ncbi:MAG: sugar phosphate isomerase/epimerase [bacterium]|nr:sugar phosphate isomerase/epimerase [bacterium]